MKTTEVKPIVLVLVGVVVVAVVVGFFISQNPQPKQVDLSKVTKADLEDRDPPKRGQPGYRERTTDPVSQ
ncbi:MAG: hypothetical protein KF857_04075 [Fimbriimonadaceae bacterium]|nr:hypothetical protein [Fimbriimonadaceae bacterium]